MSIIAMAVPRVAMVAILVLTDWFAKSFDTVLWPVLGFVFMPYTTLAYIAAMGRLGDLRGGWMALFIVAILVDAGQWSGGRFLSRRRRK